MTVEYLISLVIEGMIVTCLGLFVYSTGIRYFKSLDGDFATKETAQVTIVLFLLLAGLLGEPIASTLTQILERFGTVQQIGIVLVVSRATVNMMIRNWNHSDSLSIWSYTGGFLLLTYPSLL
jgi:hypothetical protein